jgi:putative sigma-54 modulation protein
MAVEQLDLSAEAEVEAVDGAVVRTKRFMLQPMDPSEAIEQMELLEHDFFVYYNPDTSRMNVLYRRKDGDYGIIEPDIA